jgi:hypothetical protein
MCIQHLLTSRRVSRGVRQALGQIGGKSTEEGDSYRQNLINACNRFLEQGAAMVVRPRGVSSHCLRVVGQRKVDHRLVSQSLNELKPPPFRRVRRSLRLYRKGGYSA